MYTLKINVKQKSIKRYLLAVIAGLYLVTWIWGIPAIHTSIAKDVISYYKQAVKTRSSETWEAHPRLQFGASYAILPLVTVNHYEYQVAGRWGWGGYTVDIWYFKDRVTIARFTKWIS